MKKSLFVAGFESRSGEDLLKTAVSSGRTVFATCADEAELCIPHVVPIEWNRKSPISSRTAVLKAKNGDFLLDEFLCVFDGAALASRLKSDDISAFEESLCSISMSTVYICAEVEKLFHKQRKGRMVFLLREADIFDLSTSENSDACSAPVAMAQSAFEAFAQTMAGKFLKSYIKVTLIRDIGLENAAPWIFSFLDETEEKSPENWVKVGEKPKPFLPFLKRKK